MKTAAAACSQLRLPPIETRSFLSRRAVIGEFDRLTDYCGHHPHFHVADDAAQSICDGLFRGWAVVVRRDTRLLLPLTECANIISPFDGEGKLLVLPAELGAELGFDKNWQDF